MKHILAVSIATVAIGVVSESSQPAPSSHSVPSSRSAPPRALSASRSIPPETRSFVFADGKDGVGRETVTRDGDLISGDMSVGTKRVQNHVHYEGRIAADGTIPRLEIRAWRSAAEAKHPRVIFAIIGRDSAKVIEHLGSHVDTLRFGSQRGMLPVINPSVGLTELVVARARAQQSRSSKVPILFIDALNLDPHHAADKVDAGAMTLDVTFLTADTVRIGNGRPTDQLRVIIGADGRFRGGTSGPTAKDTFSFRPTSKPVSHRE
jgi:hypothetical protein